MKPLYLVAAIAVISVVINIGVLLRPKPVDKPHPVAAPPAAPAPTVPTGPLNAYAALGSYVAASNRIPDLDWNDAQFNAFAAGLRSCYEGRPVPFNDAAERLREEINTKVQAILGETGTGDDPLGLYFAKLRAEENVQRTDSGLHYRLTEPGHGDAPATDATVLISYAGRLPTGESLQTFQATRLKVKLSDVLPGLREGITLMRPAGKALLYLPPDLSFANGNWPAEIPRGAPIILFVELHYVSAE
ncbi:FKBP-type peptidyl-prolyl cis-trans isomerase [Synoicihabitans lomoniglobus]|uniref:Peptidyl-prolyl cis-trans isomerase n=1 Tax=Synoicihabitans lomoniglobus TaxID=2909285 RepID=A0AAE9ZVE0_9BACT|nr:FKBP-type peptidyl-prolyl cis-trans isomerase [Opitutaceae bacterium LMO-M01]WED63834.1 FKBP-type peptidyl-prolyl cis-trans isomerase [Opitutaceae bacterium LMO-M01]